MNKWAVDEIIEVPENVILREYGYKPNEARNKKKASVKKKSTRKKSIESEYFLDIPTLDPYLGHESLLVRTALVRSKNFPTSKELPVVNSPSRAAHLCYHMINYDQEHMIVLAVNNQTKVTAIHESGIGGRSSTQVSSLDLIKVPILTSSTSMIVLHNHPSGISNPSREDEIIHLKIESICECIGLSLLDFLVVAQDGWVSIKAGDGGEWDEWLIKEMRIK